MLMHNSAILKILPYSYRSKRDQQRSIVRRFDFSVNKKEGDRFSLPYKIITHEQSSLFFKRKTNRMIKISELSGDQLGLTKQHLSSNGNTPVNIGAESTILDFFRSTGIFINIYGVKDDNSLIKIDMTGSYSYFNKSSYPTIKINSYNHIDITFYNSEYNDFVLEIIYVINDYNRYISYSTLLNNLKNVSCPIIFTDGVMQSPDNITEGNVYELYDVNPNNYIYNGLINITNGICDINEKLINNGYPKCAPICPETVFLYGSYDESNNLSYKIYKNDISIENEFSPRLKSSISEDGDKLCLILGNNDILRYELIDNLYNILLNICIEDGKYDYDYVSNIIEQEMNKLSNDNLRLLLEYPKYLRDYLETITTDQIYTTTISSIPSTSILKRIDDDTDTMNYITFRFNKSMSYTLFCNGRIMIPSHIADTTDYIYLYFNQSDYMTNKILINPITLIRCRNYYNPDMIYQVSAKPIYVDKNDFVRYKRISNDGKISYIRVNDGTFIYYNNEYIPIDPYTYEYDILENKYIAKDNQQGSLYKLYAEKYDIPQNKFMEKIKPNSILVDSISDDSGLIIDTASYEDTKYKYPYIRTVSMINYERSKSNTKYPSAINQIPEFNDREYTVFDKLSALAKTEMQNYMCLQDNEITNTTNNSTFTVDTSVFTIDNYIYNVVITNNGQIYTVFIFLDPCFRYIEINDKNDYVFHGFKCNISEDFVITNSGVSIFTYTDIINSGDTEFSNNDIYCFNDNNIIINKTHESKYIYPKFPFDYNEIYNKYLSLINDIKSNNELSLNDFIQVGNYYIIGKLQSDIEDKTENNIHNRIIKMTGYICHGNTIENDIFDISIPFEKMLYSSKSFTFDNYILPQIGCDISVTWFNELSIYNTDSAYSKYAVTQNMDIPYQVGQNYDQLMIFKDGILDDSCYIKENHIISKSVDNLFVSNMSKFSLYKTIDNMRSYIGTVIEILPGLDKDFSNKEFYHKKIDIMQTPIDLRYMMIFVNGIFIDNDHIIILSDNRFMLKNLDDFDGFINKYDSDLSSDKMKFYIKGTGIEKQKLNQLFFINKSSANNYMIAKNIAIQLDLGDTQISNGELELFIYYNIYDKDNIFISSETMSKSITDSRTQFLIEGIKDDFKIEVTDIYLKQSLNKWVDVDINWDECKIIDTSNNGLINDKFIINSIDIYSYPFEYDQKYKPYYKSIKQYERYKEYILTDEFYNRFRSELIGYNINDASNIYINNKDDNSNRFGYLSDFRYRALSKMHHNYPMEYMMHGRGSSLKHLKKYTYSELSKYTHKELSDKHFVHGYDDENELE